MDKSKLIEEIKQIEQEIYLLKHQSGELRLRLAVMNCPFKVGDRVTWMSRRPQVWQISKILPGFGYRSYALYGYKVKKDGNPGVRELEIHYGSDIRLAE